MLKHIKASFRAQNHVCHDWANGDISFGVMAEKLSNGILQHIESKGMLPPYKKPRGLLEKLLSGLSDDRIYQHVWEEENENS